MATKKLKKVTVVDQEPKTDWKFDADGSGQPASQDQSTLAQPITPKHQTSLTWTASEYLAHDKNSTWFISLGGGGIVIVALIYLITRDFVTITLVSGMVIIFGIFAARKPQILEYTLNYDGLQIGPKHYTFDSFKSFAVMDEGEVFSIMLLPLKRFMPTLSIYYDAKDENSIVDVLSGYLPVEQRTHDLTDQLMRKIRF